MGMVLLMAATLYNGKVVDGFWLLNACTSKDLRAGIRKNLACVAAIRGFLAWQEIPHVRVLYRWLEFGGQIERPSLHSLTGWIDAGNMNHHRLANLLGRDYAELRLHADADANSDLNRSCARWHEAADNQSYFFCDWGTVRTNPAHCKVRLYGDGQVRVYRIDRHSKLLRDLIHVQIVLMHIQQPYELVARVDEDSEEPGNVFPNSSFRTERMTWHTALERCAENLSPKLAGLSSNNNPRLLHTFGGGNSTWIVEESPGGFLILEMMTS